MPMAPKAIAAMAYLVHFARTGDPRGATAHDGTRLPRWEPHVPGSNQFMELGPKLGMSSNGAGGKWLGSHAGVSLMTNLRNLT